MPYNNTYLLGFVLYSTGWRRGRSTSGWERGAGTSNGRHEIFKILRKQYYREKRVVRAFPEAQRASATVAVWRPQLLAALQRLR